MVFSESENNTLIRGREKGGIEISGADLGVNLTGENVFRLLGVGAMDISVALFPYGLAECPALKN